VAELIPHLQWQVQCGHHIAWLNDTEFYSIKPVGFVDGNVTSLEFEVRLNNAATGTSELIAVGYNRDDAEVQARIHVGDDE
jgi:hypothetical protein